MAEGVGEVEKADLRDLRDTILTEMRAGFSGVHERQDRTNGRIGRAEVSLGAHDVRLTNMEREVFRRRRTDVEDRALAPRRVTERDVRLVMAGAAGASALVVALWKLLPILLKAVA